MFETDTNYIALPRTRNYITNPINVTSSTPANNEMYTRDTSTNVKIDVFDIAAIRSEVSSRIIIYVYNIIYGWLYYMLYYYYYHILYIMSCRLDSITLKSYPREGVDKITLRRNGFGTSVPNALK